MQGTRLGSLMVAALVAMAGCKPAAQTGGPAGNEGNKVTQTGGSAGGDTKKVTLAILAPGASDFWRIVEAGAQQAAKDFNCTVDVVAPSQVGATEQKARLEDILSRGVDGIALAPVDPKNQIEAIDKAAKQVPLVTTDTDAADSKRLCYVGTDNYAAGKVAGEQLKKALPKGGKVFACVGTLDAQNAHDRYQGIVDALKGSNVQMVDALTDGADKAKARSNVEERLVSTPDVAAFVGLWSYNGPAILDAVKAAGKVGKVKIVCFDEGAATLQGVKDGAISATVVQNPYKFGYEAVRVLAALARKQDAKIPPNKVIDTGAKVVDKTTIDAFEIEFRKLVGK